MAPSEQGPATTDLAKISWVMADVIVTIRVVIYVIMVCGPVAALLVEMFPTSLEAGVRRLRLDVRPEEKLRQLWEAAVPPPVLLPSPCNTFWGLGMSE
jgi:hypothetical protein